jgi:hypothetical protein
MMGEFIYWSVVLGSIVCLLVEYGSDPDGD